MQRVDRHDDRNNEAAPGVDPITGRPVDLREVYGELAEHPPEEVEVDTVDARQGWSGRPVLYVLIAALILGAAYLIATNFWAAEDNTVPNAGPEVAPAGDLAPPPAADAPAPPPAGEAPAPAPSPEPAPPAAEAPPPAPAPAPAP